MHGICGRLQYRGIAQWPRSPRKRPRPCQASLPRPCHPRRGRTPLDNGGASQSTGVRLQQEGPDPRAHSMVLNAVVRLQPSTHPLTTTPSMVRIRADVGQPFHTCLRYELAMQGGQTCFIVAEFRHTLRSVDLPTLRCMPYSAFNVAPFKLAVQQLPRDFLEIVVLRLDGASSVSLLREYLVRLRTPSWHATLQRSTAYATAQKGDARSRPGRP